MQGVAAESGCDGQVLGWVSAMRGSDTPFNVTGVTAVIVVFSRAVVYRTILPISTRVPATNPMYRTVVALVTG